MKKFLLTLPFALLSGHAAACAMGKMYNLPIPFNLYASGAGIALLASFVIVAYVLNAQTAQPGLASTSTLSIGLHSARVPGALLWGLRAFSVLCLLLAVAAGFFGSKNPFDNFGMTFFWITSALGLTYLTPILGNVYSLISPWRAICAMIERVSPGVFKGTLRYPSWLQYYPALLFYMTFIWIELFGMIQPKTLSQILIVYTALNICAAWLIGRDNWFKYGEFFSVFFRLVGKMAPLEYAQTHKDIYRVNVRKPFLGLLDTRAEHGSLLLFILFMISSTAFDGAHETTPWVGMFWKGIYPSLAAIVTQPYSFWLDVYLAWQAAMLFLLPLAYLAIYLFLLWVAKAITHSSVPLNTLALRFAFTLVPIAFVYNMAHYYTEFVSQGIQVLRMVSDPFARGWNLFGSAQWFRSPILLDAGEVWHTQVALILIGHIISVYLAHIEALKVFPLRRHAVLSQVPMLLLMVLLTTIGLWVLSLPIDAGQVPAGDPDVVKLAPYWTPPTAVIGPGPLPVATLPPATAVKAPVLPIAKVNTDLLVSTT
jgi:hypothetical protein